MNRLIYAILPLAFALPGCSKSEDSSAESAPVAQEAAPATQVTSAAIPVSLPKIAYVYDYGYRLAADRIPELQRKHADLC